MRTPNNSEVGTIHIGVGILFVLLGLVVFGRLPVITPAFLLGGVLTMLLGAPAQGGGLDQLTGVVGLLNTVVPSAFSDAGNARDVVRFVVLLVGVVLLAGAMYLDARLPMMPMALRKRPIPSCGRSGVPRSLPLSVAVHIMTVGSLPFERSLSCRQRL